MFSSLRRRLPARAGLALVAGLFVFGSGVVAARWPSSIPVAMLIGFPLGLLANIPANIAASLQKKGNRNRIIEVVYGIAMVLMVIPIAHGFLAFANLVLGTFACLGYIAITEKLSEVELRMMETCSFLGIAYDKFPLQLFLGAICTSVVALVVTFVTALANRESPTPAQGVVPPNKEERPNLTVDRASIATHSH